MSDSYLELNMKEFVIIPVILETIEPVICVQKFGFFMAETRQFKKDMAELALEFDRRITKKEYLAILSLFREHLGWDLQFELIIASGFVDNTLSYHDITDFVRNGIKWVYTHGTKHPLDLYREWGAYALYNEYILRNSYPEIKIASSSRRDMSVALGELSKVRYSVPSYRSGYHRRSMFASEFNSKADY